MHRPQTWGSRPLWEHFVVVDLIFRKDIRSKGMWMGGTIPLDYDVRDRKLVANSEEAELPGAMNGLAAGTHCGMASVARAAMAYATARVGNSFKD
jgi:hypothetical protein